MVLDLGVKSLAITEADLGLAFNWRCGPAARPLNHDSYASGHFTPNGKGLRPFSPVHLRARPQPDGAIALSWTRRSRDLAADNWILPDVPLAEAAERYDVDIWLTGGALLRAIPGLVSSSFTYSSTMISNDLGASAANITFRVYQIGRVGRGAPAITTLQL